MNKLSRVEELVRMNKYADALGEVNNILNLDNKNQEAHICKARILNIMGRKEEAMVFYESIINQFPENIDAHLDLVDEYSFAIKVNEHKEPFSLKIIRLGERIKILDSHKAPYFEMGNAYRILGEISLAIDSYNNAIQQKALDARICALYSKNTREKSNIEYAIRRISEDREIIYDSLCSKAESFQEMDRNKEAIETYLKAIDMNIFRKREFESHDEYYSIRNIYDAMGNKKEAKAYEEKAKRMEKIYNDAQDKSKGRMTEDEFNNWYINYFEFDKEGNIIGQKKKIN